jgi:hypothetical protein
MATPTRQTDRGITARAIYTSRGLIRHMPSSQMTSVSNNHPPCSPVCLAACCCQQASQPASLPATCRSPDLAPTMTCSAPTARRPVDRQLISPLRHKVPPLRGLCVPFFRAFARACCRFSAVALTAASGLSGSTPWCFLNFVLHQ